MHWPSLDSQIACEALRHAGVACDPKAVRIEAREDRWAVFVPEIEWLGFRPIRTHLG